MKEMLVNKEDFLPLYSKSHRLATAAFLVSGTIVFDEDLKTILKKLSLSAVSIAVNLKDNDCNNAKKLLIELERKFIEIISLLDVACISGLVSKMNVSILKEEFKSLSSEFEKFASKINTFNDVSVDGLLEKKSNENNDWMAGNSLCLPQKDFFNEQSTNSVCAPKNGNGHKRKDLRKNMILDFVKRHSPASIKDISSNVTGCSEKTIQRELTALVSSGEIKKTGERRWSKYSYIS